MNKAIKTGKSTEAIEKIETTPSFGEHVKKMLPASTICFMVTEKIANIPYVVMWIGKHNLPSVEHFQKLEGAKLKVEYLKMLGVNATLLLDINQSEQLQ